MGCTACVVSKEGYGGLQHHHRRLSQGAGGSCTPKSHAPIPHSSTTEAQHAAFTNWLIPHRFQAGVYLVWLQPPEGLYLEWACVHPAQASPGMATLLPFPHFFFICCAVLDAAGTPGHSPSARVIVQWAAGPQAAGGAGGAPRAVLASGGDAGDGGGGWWRGESGAVRGGQLPGPHSGP